MIIPLIPTSINKGALCIIVQHGPNPNNLFYFEYPKRNKKKQLKTKLANSRL